jgi:hypothetical protein
MVILTQTTPQRLLRLLGLFLESPYSYGLAILCCQTSCVTAQFYEFGVLPTLPKGEPYINEST